MIEAVKAGRIKFYRRGGLVTKNYYRRGGAVSRSGYGKNMSRLGFAHGGLHTTEEGTASFANVAGYEVGGKTGTAEKAKYGGYTKDKINTFVSIFPTSKPKYVLLVLLDEPKPSKEYVYYYRDGRQSYKGNWRNTAGWTSVEIAGRIIEKIGPILATKYIEVN